MEEATCGFIGCGELATTRLTGTQGFDDSLYACNAHISELWEEGNMVEHYDSGEWLKETMSLEEWVAAHYRCENETCKEAVSHSITRYKQIDAHTELRVLVYSCEGHLAEYTQAARELFEETDGAESSMEVERLYFDFN